MVLEKTNSPYDVEDVIIDAFDENIALLSENALAKDWLLPEEDKAWVFL